MSHEKSVVWNDCLLLGHKEIDADHKAFFEIALMLECSLESEDLNIGHVAFLTDALCDYVEGHFTREELLMENIGFNAWVKEHIERHDFFRKLIINISIGARCGNRASIKLLSKSCTAWFWTHIVAFDSKINEHINLELADGRSIDDLIKMKRDASAAR